MPGAQVGIPLPPRHGHPVPQRITKAPSGPSSGLLPVARVSLRFGTNVGVASIGVASICKWNVLEFVLLSVVEQAFQFYATLKALTPRYISGA